MSVSATAHSSGSRKGGAGRSTHSVTVGPCQSRWADRSLTELRSRGPAVEWDENLAVSRQEPSGHSNSVPPPVPWPFRVFSNASTWTCPGWYPGAPGFLVAEPVALVSDQDIPMLVVLVQQ